MILGIGVDILEVGRLERALERHGERLAARIFTDSELSDCRHRVDRLQALAARFAAKEACMKALGTGWSGGVTFQQIEVVRPAGRPPSLRLTGAADEVALRLGVRKVFVTLTHQPAVAAAVVVLEG